MSNNLLNLNYFMMQEYSYAIYVFCSNIIHVFQLLELCYPPAPASQWWNYKNVQPCLAYVC